jgi:hypothetical protein
MSKPKLIVLHGMGAHSAEQIKQTVIEAANSALHRYQRFETINFQDHVAVTGIGYDDIFEQERKRVAELNQSVSAYLSANGGVAPDFIKKIVSLEQKISEDNFFTTHALDIIFYLTLKGEEVRLRVIREIADVWANYNGEDVHVLGHSLGTAVLHDTLHKAYTGGIDGHTLSCVTHKFKSLWMMANVSNLTHSMSPFGVKFDPFNSVVRPSDSSDGCTESFYNYWHKLDPFTLFHRFEPKNDGSWLPMEIYEDSYSGKEIKTIGSSLNPHDLTEYISNPYVSYRFLKKIMPSYIFNPTLAEMHEANSKYIRFTAEAQKIADHVGEIDSIDDIKELVLATKNFEAYIKTLKDNLGG